MSSAPPVKPMTCGYPLSPADGKFARVLRRTFDVALSAVILLLTAPVLVVAALALATESGTGVVFRQQRLGHRGEPFELIKLRTMYTDARERFPELYAYGAADPLAPFHARSDPRVTPVGRIVRKFSVDELPNFWNVVRGEMSVVGPRPEIPELAHLYGDRLAAFLSVKPGVTSPAKACGRDALTFLETFELEMQYIEQRSLALDLATIAETAMSVVRGRGVH